VTRRRTINDGLPHRVYERRGTNVYSIGYKRKDQSWAFRLKCSIDDKRGIARLRRDAVRRALLLCADGTQIDTMDQLITDWFNWQAGLPAKSTSKRADTTMQENARESKNLRAVFGEMAIVDVKAHHAYTYLDRCDELGRGSKGNKEMVLLQLILQRAVRKGILDANPLLGLEKLATKPSTRYVETDELDLVLKVGKNHGGQMYRAALALQAASLCVRRPQEVRALQWSAISEEGILWSDGKPRSTSPKQAVLITWSPALQHVVDEVMKIDGHIKRPEAGFVFGTQAGTPYTRGGWKKTLGRLMAATEEEAKLKNVPFRKFSLQDQRPRGVTDKISAGHTDVQDATLHSSPRLIQRVYDRRRKVQAGPAP